MQTPGQYVLLNKVQSSSKQINKKKKQSNKQLKKKIEGAKKEHVKGKGKQVAVLHPPKNVVHTEDKKGKQKKNKKQKPKAEQQTSNISNNIQKKKPNKNKQTTNSEEKKDFHEDLADRLKASRFRFINEQLYTHTGDEAHDVFNQDDTAFTTYHQGYRKQVEQWPLNPLDRIINSIKKLPSHYIVADFGCGEARLAKTITQKCYSFDLVAANDSVIACNMAHTPLSDDSVNIAVFCLSLMGTNLRDFLLEANRVLKVGGHLKVAEIESRFENVSEFIRNVKQFGFDLITKDISTKVFYFLYFKKMRDVKESRSLPTFSLKPCIYKKR